MAVNPVRRWNSFRALIKKNSNNRYLTIEQINWGNDPQVKIGLPAVRDEIFDDPFVGIILKQMKEKELGQSK